MRSVVGMVGARAGCEASVTSAGANTVEQWVVSVINEHVLGGRRVVAAKCRENTQNDDCEGGIRAGELS